MKLNISTFNVEIVIQTRGDEQYISLTDIAKLKNKEHADDVIKNWLRNRSTIELLGFWEQIYNPNFEPVEFDGFRKEAGLNSFVLTPKRWIEKTNAVGIISKQGKYGGTFAHKDIAFEFASWISIEFKLYLIKEFQRLKEQESQQNSIEWSIQRVIAKINYSIHADAIKDNLIPKSLTKEQSKLVYSTEADMLNVALFGMTAKEWKLKNKDNLLNLRDAATLEQLVVLSNLESINALLIQQGRSTQERILQLNQVAISQMKTLLNTRRKKQLSEFPKFNYHKTL
jgi:hypothetical protein